MKKTSKKLVALVLSLVMVLSFSVNTFAATNDTISVQVVFEAHGSTPTVHDTGVLYEDITTVTAQSGDTIESIVKAAITDLGLTAQWKEVNDYYFPDEIKHNALDSITTPNRDVFATWIASDYTEGAGWVYEAFDDVGNAIICDNYMCCITMGTDGIIHLLYKYDDYTDY